MKKNLTNLEKKYSKIFSFLFVFLITSFLFFGLIVSSQESEENILDSDSDGWADYIEQAYNTNITDPDDYPVDTDLDGTPDESSLDNTISGDLDDDDDGLSDAFEDFFGSDKTDKSDVILISIESVSYYLIDKDNDGLGDILFNSDNNQIIDFQFNDQKLLIDIDMDGQWDYYYENGIVEKYSSTDDFPLLYILIIAIAIVLITIIILFKTGVIVVYEEEYIVEK